MSFPLTMRISGGQARGIPLQVPAGDAVRPATDGMRQAVFSSLAPRIEKARFLDLFAGSGAYGLEALSRGASGGTFVEKSHKAIACLRRNLELVSKSLSRTPAELGRIIQLDVLSAPYDEQPLADLVFVDPPYDLIETMAYPIFEKLTTALPLAHDPIVIFEMPGEIELTPPSWSCIKRLGKGKRQPSVCFFQRT